MEKRNPFGIEDDGRTAGMLSYFFVLGWSMAYLAFHQYERTSLSSYQLRQTLMLYLSYIVTRYGIPVLFGMAGVHSAFFASLLFSLPVNALFIALWVIGLNGAISGEERPIPIFGEHAQRIFAAAF